MKVEILIVSYHKDMEWLRWNLQTTAKFARGFSGVTVLVPNRELSLFQWVKEQCRLLGYNTPTNPLYGHLAHQAAKCRADQWCPEADFVLHSDSDCCWLKPVTPADYFEKGKPVMLMEPYANLKGNPWQPVVESVLKMRVTHEFMRRHPQVNPIGVYSDLRKHIETVQGKAFDEYVLSGKPTFVWSFTEHNVIGAFAWNDHHWHDKYHWIDLAKEKAPEPKLIQFWSHSPPDKPQDTPNGTRCVPAQVIASILEAPDAPKSNSPYPTSRDVFGYWLNDQGLLGEGVEVGCAYGHNASTILSQWKGQRLYMVDPWERQPAEVYREKTDDVPYDIWYSDCCKLAERDPRAVIVRKYSVEAAKDFKDGSLSFVVIDANHSYGAVLADLDAWWSKIKPGGVVGLHDHYIAYEAPHFCEVAAAVPRWMNEHKIPYSVTPCTTAWARKPD